MADKKPRPPRGPGQAITVKRLKSLLERAEAEYKADHDQTDETKKLSNGDRIKLLALMQRVSAMLVAKDRHATMIRAAKLAGEKKAASLHNWA